MAKKRLSKKPGPRTKSGRKKAAAKRTKVTRKSTSRKKSPSKRVVKSKVTTKKKKRSRPSAESVLHRLDKEILKLVNQRAEATTRWIEKQPNPSQALYDPATDDELWRQLEDLNNGPLPGTAVRGVFREILSAARRRVKTLRVVYLGPPFSFTHIASIERFGEAADFIPVSTIAAVFEEVNRGHAAYGLVPIENSTDGRVVDTLDMFQRLPIRICGEVQMAIHHNLLARCPRGEVVEVYSKPQALSQCRDWLAKNMPHSRQFPVTSTSTAAELARTKQGVAAVASRQAATEYGLQVIAEDIEDNPRNITRFAVIGDEKSRRTGHDRTSVLLQIPHRPGSLCDALAIFKKNKINLTWIESFPLRGEQDGYLFFLDFEGHETESAISRALKELETKAIVLNVLGSYPRSDPRE